MILIEEDATRLAKDCAGRNPLVIGSMILILSDDEIVEGLASQSPRNRVNDSHQKEKSEKILAEMSQSPRNRVNDSHILDNGTEIPLKTSQSPRNRVNDSHRLEGISNKDMAKKSQSPRNRVNDSHRERYQPAAILAEVAIPS